MAILIENALQEMETISLNELVRRIAEAVREPRHERLLLSKSEVAAETGLSARTIMRMVTAGQFPEPLRHSNGGKCFWTREQINRFLSQQGRKEWAKDGQKE